MKIKVLNWDKDTNIIEIECPLCKGDEQVYKEFDELTEEELENIKDFCSWRNEKDELKQIEECYNNFKSDFYFVKSCKYCKL